MWDDSVPKKLKELHEAGNRIVFFTNQAGIEKKKLTPKSFQNKLDDIIKELGVPVLVSFQFIILIIISFIDLNNVFFEDRKKPCSIFKKWKC